MSLVLCVLTIDVFHHHISLAASRGMCYALFCVAHIIITTYWYRYGGVVFGGALCLIVGLGHFGRGWVCGRLRNCANGD